MLSHHARIIPSVALILSAVGCSAQKEPTLVPLTSQFKAQTDSTQIEIDACTTPAAPIQTNLKYVFVIDNSRSNAVNYQLKYTKDASGNTVASPLCPINTNPPAGSGIATYGTDPDRTRRYQALLDFTTTIQNDPVRAADTSRYYSLVEFSTSPSTLSGFTNNLNDFRSLVQRQFTTGVDEGTTDYLAALNQVKGMIQADINNARRTPGSKASAYVIVHISDGFPIPGAGILCDGTTPVFIGSDGQPIEPQAPNQILQVVQSIAGLEADTQYVDSITLFTGYVFVNGNEDPGARQLLKDMARVGNGVAYDFGNGKAVDFSLFTLPPRTLRFELGEIFVENSSSVWWPGEIQPLLDSDLDGLPDRLETGRFRADRRDSDGDGLSDLVEYRQATGVGNNAGNGDDDGDGLSNFEELYLGNSQNRSNFDSNKNLIPDGLEFRSHIEFRSSPNGILADDDLDGIPNITEIKYGLPPATSNHQLIGAAPISYRLRRTSATELQECFHLSVSNVRRLSETDMIRVHFVEKSPLVFNQLRLRTREARFTPGSNSLNFDLRVP